MPEGKTSSGAQSVHKGHRARTLHRVRTEGLSGFEPHQVLELLLFFAIPRIDTSELAHRLIDRFGSVGAVLRADREALQQVKGIGPGTASFLTTLGECVAAYDDLRPEDRLHLETGRQVLRFAADHRPADPGEHVWQLCLSPSGCIQSFARLTDGIAWREERVLRTALKDMVSVRARSSIIVVYGPRVRPDTYDTLAAESYGYTLSTLGSELLDVLFIAEDGSTGLRRLSRYDPSAFGRPRSLLAECYND